MARKDLYQRLVQQVRDDIKARNNLPHEIKVGEIIAHRFWFVSYSRLHSVSQNYIWLPGIQPKLKSVTGYYAGNGYYAYKTSQLCQRSCNEWRRYNPQKRFVRGTVAFFDEVVEHENGYRAQSAKIISLDFGDYGDLDKLRKLYGV